MENHIEVVKDVDVVKENGVDDGVSDLDLSIKESSESSSGGDEVFEEALELESGDNVPEISTRSIAGDSEVNRANNASGAADVSPCFENSEKMNDLPAREDTHDGSCVDVAEGSGSVEYNVVEDGGNSVNQGKNEVREDTGSDAIDGETEESEEENLMHLKSGNSEDADSSARKLILETSEISEVANFEKLDQEQEIGDVGRVKGSDISASCLSPDHEEMEHISTVAVKENVESSTENESAGEVEGNQVHFKMGSDTNSEGLDERKMDGNLVSEFQVDKNDISENGHSELKGDGHRDHYDSPRLENEVMVQKSVHEVEPVVNASSSADDRTLHPASTSHTASTPEPHSQIIEQKSHDSSSSRAGSDNLTRPAGLGRGAPLSSVRTPQPRANGTISAAQNKLIVDNANGGEAEEYDEIREKLQMIRVKFLRLAHRLGQTPHNVVVAQVLYRLGLAEQLHGRSGGRVAAFSFDRASAMAEQLEALAQEPLDFTCTIMVLGKSGVGKSATINSIFDETMFSTDAFEPGTKKVQDIVGTVQGIKVRLIDTPGLFPSMADQRHNENILQSVKRFIKKTPPDIVLYLDRLDMQSRDSGDTPLLRTITGIFGPSIWFNAIVVLTHAASAPPEGANGTVTSYDMFVSQRSLVIQQAIRQAAGDTRLMNPVSLVENHSACRTNRAGQRVLPNGQVWKPHLLLLSFASKILAEANTLLKLQDTPSGRPHAAQVRSHPLPYLLSSLLQSRPEVKRPFDQYGNDEEDDSGDDNMDETSELEEVSGYDELPPFKSLTKAELQNLTKTQRKAYYDELEFREKLFMKKQLIDEKRRRKMMKKIREDAKDMPDQYTENGEEEASGAASVMVPIPDLVLPPSFDSDNPTYRYRYLDSVNPWFVRAVHEPHSWDHDVGYDGVNVERLFVVKDKVPVSFSSQILKDKKDVNLQMEVASTIKHGKRKGTSFGFDMKSIGKDYAYTLRSETKLSNSRLHKASAGMSVTMLGNILTGGLKLEDKLIIGKRGQMVVSGGAVYGQGDVAFGGSLEATLKDKDPLGRFFSTLGVSVMDWHGDLAIGCNSQTQIPVGRNTNLISCLNVNNRGSGQISIRINTSEWLQVALIGLIPLIKKLFGYSQQVQYE